VWTGELFRNEFAAVTVTFLGIIGTNL